MKNTGQLDPTWPVTRLTRSTCFTMSSCCPHCVAHFIFIPLLILTVRQTTSPDPSTQHLGHTRLSVTTIRCSLRRSWWGVPRVLVYNFVFNHLFESILRNWPPKLGYWKFDICFKLALIWLICVFVWSFGLICIYLSNFLFNL